MPGAHRDPLKKLAAEGDALLRQLVHRWRDEAVKTGHRIARMVVTERDPPNLDYFQKKKCRCFLERIVCGMRGIGSPHSHSALSFYTINLVLPAEIVRDDVVGSRPGGGSSSSHVIRHPTAVHWTNGRSSSRFNQRLLAIVLPDRYFVKTMLGM